MTRKHVVRSKHNTGLSSHSSHAKIWIGVAVAALVIAVGAAFGIEQENAVSAAGSSISAEQTSFDFGQVRMSGGLVRTKFPLAVHGSPLITLLTTS